ncbi:putative transporter small subunit [Vibrio sp.]|nr:putative transporter small subunit [Vibrio sp.]
MLALYILIWPVISAVILYIIVKAFFKDVAKAKKDNDTLV